VDDEPKRVCEAQNVTAAEVRSALLGPPRWGRFALEVWSSKQGFAWDVRTDVHERVWIDRTRGRWRAESAEGVSVDDGTRWWIAPTDAMVVVHHDGGGKPMTLGRPFVFSMVMPSLVSDDPDDDVELRVTSESTWLGRPCSVVDVSSNRRESGSLPDTLASYDSEGCWLYDTYECWIDLSLGIVLRLRLSRSGEVVVAREIRSMTIDPDLPDELFKLDVPPDVRVVDAGRTPPWKWYLTDA
jgi:hypothetical protein